MRVEKRTPGGSRLGWCFGLHLRRGAFIQRSVRMQKIAW